MSSDHPHGNTVGARHLPCPALRWSIPPLNRLIPCVDLAASDFGASRGQDHERGAVAAGGLRVVTSQSAETQRLPMPGMSDSQYGNRQVNPQCPIPILGIRPQQDGCRHPESAQGARRRRPENPSANPSGNPSAWTPPGSTPPGGSLLPVPARIRESLARMGADSAGVRILRGPKQVATGLLDGCLPGAARSEQVPPTAESRDQSPPCPPDRTSRPPGHPTTAPAEQTTRTPGQANTPPPEQTGGTPWPPEHPTFRAWLLAHAEKRPRRSGRFLYRLARDAARCDGWNTPDELTQAMETYESGTGHGAPPMPAAERVNAAVVLYRARVGVEPRGVDDRPVMTPVDPAEGHDSGTAG